MNDISGNWMPPTDEDGNQAGYAVRALRTAGQVWCGLTGHRLLLHFEPDRLSLECSNCGWRSSGIPLAEGQQ